MALIGLQPASPGEDRMTAAIEEKFEDVTVRVCHQAIQQPEHPRSPAACARAKGTAFDRFPERLAMRNRDQFTHKSRNISVPAIPNCIFIFE
ncbi:MAG: hypothetical protein JWP63_1104 [Candidatus Solibacter sp.]|nr:hypothetical protein [Candidatus Solibacter sp.]